MRHPGCVDLLLHRLGVDRQCQLPDVGHLHRLGVDRLRQLPGEDRRHLLRDVDHLGVGRPDVDRRCPLGDPNAYPAGKRMGCYPDVGHLAWHPDVDLPDARFHRRRACPAGMRTGCCPDVGHLAWRRLGAEPRVPERSQLVRPEPLLLEPPVPVLLVLPELLGRA